MTQMEKKDIIRRLHKLNGQVQGIERMVEDGVRNEEIIMQINAVKKASHRIGQMVLQAHLSECIQDAAAGKNADVVFESCQNALEFYSRM